MQLFATSLPEVILIKPRVYEDHRGFFMETFQSKEFREHNLPTRFVQVNHSGSKQGTLRGLHYQIHFAQGKMVQVIIGEIFDVAVDLRKSSPNFGKATWLNLSARERSLLWVPPGFAHGFYVISEWAEVIYKTTNFYQPKWERTLIWNDPSLAVPWPLVHPNQPELSSKDREGLRLSQCDVYK